jgi:hypothetical protein
MSTHQAEFHLDRPLAECLAACAAAVRQLGWRLERHDAAAFICEEVQHSNRSFGWPVRAEIRLVALVPERTHITIAGSSSGSGPFQSRHVRARVEVLVREITRGASRAATSVTGNESKGRRAVIVNGIQLSDASNGTTGVFVNGRQLHLQEIIQLQQQLPMVLSGRYWMDAAGNFGYEGGLFLGNLRAVAAARRGQREGILSTNDKVGVVVIGGDVLIK